MTEIEHAKALAEQMLHADELTLSRTDLDLAAKALLALARNLRRTEIARENKENRQ